MCRTGISDVPYTGIDVICAVVSPVHDQLDFLISENIKFADQLTNRLDIRNVSGKLPVVERQAAVFPEKKGQIDLRQVLTVFVFAVSDLLHRLRVTGNRCTVVSPAFLFCMAFPLQAEEVRLGFFRYGLEDLRASLGRDILPIRMPMKFCLFPEPEQRILILQDQVIRDRKDLLVSGRKAGLKICSNTGHITDLVE